MYNTKQRNEIMNIFSNNKDKLFSAKEILSTLDNKVSKATLYRYLDILVDNHEIIKTYDNQNECFLFQYGLLNVNMIHLKCSMCNKIYNLSCNDANLLINHISSTHNFIINQKQTVILGKCAACANRII